MSAQLPAVGVVQVGEEQNPTAEEGEQHENTVDFVQQSVLLLILGRWKHFKSDSSEAENRFLACYVSQCQDEEL